MLFLSYAEEDGGTAREIADWFAGKGIEVYFFEDSQRRGGQFIEENANAIYTADAFIALVSPDFASSYLCSQETQYAVLLEGEIRKTDPSVSFVYVLMKAEVPFYSVGYLKIRDWLPATSTDGLHQSLGALLGRIRSAKQRRPDGPPKPAEAEQVSRMAHPTFRNRDDETDLVLHGLTTVGGNGFWLVIAPPQLGKSWFLGNVTTMLKEHGGWEVAWVDVRDYPGASRADSLAVLGRFFGLDSPAGDEAALTRLIAQRIVAGGKPYLCLLDSADLLPEPTAASLRRHFSEIYRLVQNAGRPGIRLALIVASRKGDEWRGVRPVPRLTLLRLTEFKADVVRHALRDLALQMDRDFNEAELGRFAALLLGLSEGLPELLMECLRWIKSEQWVDVDWLAGPQAFERLGRPYVRNWLLSHDSLQPADPELDAQRQRALEHALRVLAPYRLFTQSHLRHHWELDQDLANALAAVDWSMEDLWDAVSGTAVLTRPLDEPWQVMQPAIRRLLFRYFYRSDTERADAHLLARDFAKRWSEAQDTEQVIGVIECLWHELSALIYSGDGNIEERLCESARELVGSLQQSNLFTERELRESGQRRLIDDEEFQEAVSSIPRLIDRLIQIVAETEGRSK